MLTPHAKHIRMPGEMMADPVVMFMRRSPDHPTLASLISQEHEQPKQQQPQQGVAGYGALACAKPER